MSAGASTKAHKAQQLERLLTAAYGPAFREKAVVTAFGAFRLGDAFAECGLEDPRAPVQGSEAAYGLWQMTAGDPTTVGSQAVAISRYIAESRERWERSRAESAAAYRRWVVPAWPLSLGPRSPHGDPLR